MSRASIIQNGGPVTVVSVRRQMQLIKQMEDEAEHAMDVEKVEEDFPTKTASSKKHTANKKKAPTRRKSKQLDVDSDESEESVPLIQPSKAKNSKRGRPKKSEEKEEEDESEEKAEEYFSSPIETNKDSVVEKTVIKGRRGKKPATEKKAEEAVSCNGEEKQEKSDEPSAKSNKSEEVTGTQKSTNESLIDDQRQSGKEIEEKRDKDIVSVDSAAKSLTINDNHSSGSANGSVRQTMTSPPPVLPPAILPNPLDKIENWTSAMNDKIEKNEILSFVKYGSFISSDSLHSNRMPSSASNNPIDTTGSFLLHINNKQLQTVQEVVNQQYSQIISKSTQVNNEEIIAQLSSVYDVFPQELDEIVSSTSSSSSSSSSATLSTLTESWQRSICLNDGFLLSSNAVKEACCYEAEDHYYETKEEKDKVDKAVNESLHWWGIRPEPLLLTEILQRCPKRPLPPAPMLTAPPAPRNYEQNGHRQTSRNSRSPMRNNTSTQQRYETTRDASSRKRSRSPSSSSSHNLHRAAPPPSQASTINRNSDSPNHKRPASSSLSSTSHHPALVTLPTRPPQRIEDYFGNLLSYSRMKDGSRFIQSAIEQASDHSLRVKIIEELQPAFFEVITDHYANYVIQKLFDYMKSEDFLYFLPVFTEHFLHLSEHRVSHFLVMTFLRRVVGKVYSEAALKPQAIAFFQQVSERAQAAPSSFAMNQQGSTILIYILQSFPDVFVEPIVQSLVNKTEELLRSEGGCKLLQTILQSGRDIAAQDIATKVEAKMTTSYLGESHLANLVKALLAMKRHRKLMTWKLINSCFRDDNSSSSSSSSSDTVLVKLLNSSTAYGVFEKLVENGEDGQLSIMEQFMDRHAARVNTSTHGPTLLKLVAAALDKKIAATTSSSTFTSWNKESDNALTQIGSAANQSYDKDRERDRDKREDTGRRSREREEKDKERHREKEREAAAKPHQSYSRYSQDRAKDKDRRSRSNSRGHYERSERTRDDERRRDWERAKEKDRLGISAGRDGSRERERDRDRERDKRRYEADRDREKERERERDRERDRDRDRDRERERVKETEKDRRRENRRRSKSRSRSRSRSNSPHHSSYRSNNHHSHSLTHSNSDHRQHTDSYSYSQSRSRRSDDTEADVISTQTSIAAINLSPLILINSSEDRPPTPVISSEDYEDLDCKRIDHCQLTILLSQLNEIERVTRHYSLFQSLEGSNASALTAAVRSQLLDMCQHPRCSYLIQTLLTREETSPFIKEWISEQLLQHYQLLIYHKFGNFALQEAIVHAEVNPIIALCAKLKGEVSYLVAQQHSVYVLQKLHNRLMSDSTIREMMLLPNRHCEVAEYFRVVIVQYRSNWRHLCFYGSTSYVLHPLITKELENLLQPLLQVFIKERQAFLGLGSATSLLIQSFALLPDLEQISFDELCHQRIGLRYCRATSLLLSHFMQQPNYQDRTRAKIIEDCFSCAVRGEDGVRELWTTKRIEDLLANDCMCQVLLHVLETASQSELYLIDNAVESDKSRLKEKIRNGNEFVSRLEMQLAKSLFVVISPTMLICEPEQRQSTPVISSEDYEDLNFQYLDHYQLTILLSQLNEIERVTRHYSLFQSLEGNSASTLTAAVRSQLLDMCQHPRCSYLIQTLLTREELSPFIKEWISEQLLQHYQPLIYHWLGNFPLQEAIVQAPIKQMISLCSQLKGEVASLAVQQCSSFVLEKLHIRLMCDAKFRETILAPGRNSEMAEYLVALLDFYRGNWESLCHCPAACRVLRPLITKEIEDLLQPLLPVICKTRKSFMEFGLAVQILIQSLAMLPDLEQTTFEELCHQRIDPRHIRTTSLLLSHFMQQPNYQDRTRAKIIEDCFSCAVRGEDGTTKRIEDLLANDCMCQVLLRVLETASQSELYLIDGAVESDKSRLKEKIRNGNEFVSMLEERINHHNKTQEAEKGLFSGSPPTLIKEPEQRQSTPVISLEDYEDMDCKRIDHCQLIILLSQLNEIERVTRHYSLFQSLEGSNASALTAAVRSQLLDMCQHPRCSYLIQTLLKREETSPFIKEWISEQLLQHYQLLIHHKCGSFALQEAIVHAEVNQVISLCSNLQGEVASLAVQQPSWFVLEKLHLRLMSDVAIREMMLSSDRNSERTEYLRTVIEQYRSNLKFLCFHASAGTVLRPLITKELEDLLQPLLQVIPGDRSSFMVHGIAVLLLIKFFALLPDLEQISFDELCHQRIGLRYSRATSLLLSHFMQQPNYQDRTRAKIIEDCFSCAVRGEDGVRELWTTKRVEDLLANDCMCQVLLRVLKTASQSELYLIDGAVESDKSRLKEKIRNGNEFVSRLEERLTANNETKSRIGAKSNSDNSW